MTRFKMSYKVECYGTVTIEAVDLDDANQQLRKMDAEALIEIATHKKVKELPSVNARYDSVECVDL